MYIVHIFKYWITIDGPVFKNSSKIYAVEEVEFKVDIGVFKKLYLHKLSTWL